MTLVLLLSCLIAQPTYAQEQSPTTSAVEASPDSSAEAISLTTGSHSTDSSAEPASEPHGQTSADLKQQKIAATANSMSILDAAILGVVEGLTEYLPVSSTGHLIVTQDLLNIVPNEEIEEPGLSPAEQAANAFAIAIQGGAILAVLGLYWPRCKQILFSLGNKDLPQQPGSASEGRRLLIALIAGFLPAAVLGLIFNDWIESKLFGMRPTIAAWIVGGIGILALSKWLKNRGRKDADDGLSLSQITWKIALAIGFFQCVAMWPGTSRSLMTIAGGLLLGLSMTAAVEFAFLLGLVTLGAATAYAVKQDGALMLEYYSISSLLVGTLAATVSAAVAVKWMVSYLKKHDLAIFGWYRLAIGIIGIAALLFLS